VPAPAVSYCCFVTTTGSNPPQGRQNGNLQVDPKFLVAGEPDLSPFSPVIDSAAFSATLDPATDFAGRPRTADGDGDSVHAPDLGALEYQPLRDDGPAPMPGGVSSLDLDLPSNVSIPYYLGLSFTNTGIPVAGKRTLRLWPDPLLVMVLNGQLPNHVLNFVGRMNASGFARAHIQWPNDARLKGLVFFTAGITLQAGFPGGVRCVTNGVKLSL